MFTDELVHIILPELHMSVWFSDRVLNLYHRGCEFDTSLVQSQTTLNKLLICCVLWQT